MKSFLRHLAAGVIRPQTSVHPFPESIYSGEQSHRSAGRVAPIVSASSMEHEAVSTVPTAIPFHRASQPVASSPLESQAETAARAPFQPLLPQYLRESAQATSPFAHLPQQSDGDTPSPSSSPKLRIAHDEGHDGSERVVVGQASQSERAVAKQFPLIPVPSQNQVLAAQLKAARAAQTPPRAYAEAPHSDDIQIHIGRVEVVAVQQAEPRRTPAPARKGLSLDEYLSRRNGRNG